MTPGRKRLAALVEASVIVLGACGDDDGPTTASGGTTTSEPTGGEGTEAFCEDVVKIQAIEPDIPEDASEEEQARLGEEFFQEEFLPLADKLEAEAPASAKEEISAVVAFAKDKGLEFFEDPRFGPIEASANEVAAEACGAEEASITGVDYAFQGAPAELESGPTLFRFSNKGKELHEMQLLRKKADTTESFDELLELPQEAAQAKVDRAGGASAFRGDTDTALVDLEAGDYVMLCFIPVGLTPEAAESDQGPEAPPHFTRGMKQEFKVS